MRTMRSTFNEMCDAADAIEKFTAGKDKAQHIMEYAERRMIEENEIGNEPLTRYWAAYRDGAYRVFYALFERD